MPSTPNGQDSRITIQPSQPQAPHSPNPVGIGLIVFTLPLTLVLVLVLRQKFLRWRYTQRVAQLERAWKLTVSRRKD